MSNEEVYHHSPKIDEPVAVEAVEQSDRGLFDFMKKKEEQPEKCEETAISSEFQEKVNVCEPEPVVEEKHESLLEKIHHSHSGSSSSSSSDEECEDGEKKKKKKKSIKDKIKEKIEEHKEKKEEEKIEKQEEDTCVPVEKYEEVAVPPPVVHPTPTPEPEEKKGFIEKIKEKLPGGHKKVEEEHAAPPPPTPVVAPCDSESSPKEKKGIFEKIKEKIPGYHSKSEEEKEKEKEKVKECD